MNSVVWADEILVVDSCSIDKTRERASASGAVVIEQPWLGWGPQRNLGAHEAKNDWVFFLEADEIVDAELARSIQQVLASNPDPGVGFCPIRRDEFLGEIMPDIRRGARQNRFVRLYNKRHSQWDETMLVHEEVRCPRGTRPLAGKLIHWRNYSIGQQMDTLNRNAALEAQEKVRDADFRLRHLYVKPLLRFLWVFVWKQNFRKGSKGFIWAGMNATAEFLRQSKTWEALHAPPVPHPPQYPGDPGSGSA